MRRWIPLLLVGGVLVAGLSGCKKRGATEAELSASMIVEPQGASPGMIVRVSATKPLFGRDHDAKVEIGGQSASIARVVSDTEAEIMVPQAPEGATTIGLTSSKSEGKESANFTVLAAHAQQLVLKMAEGRVELVAVHATSGEPSGREELGGEAQLSFDVLNKAGAVVYTGVISNPAQQRMEIFDGLDARSVVLRREKMQHDVTFALKIPKLADGATVKFFEAPPGNAAPDHRAREARKFVAEVKVPGGKE